MATKKIKMVSCRYQKCFMLHDSKELPQIEAVKSGDGKYYHPDCFHTSQTVMQIRDTFVKEINPVMTGKQIGELVATVNNMIFTKKIDVDLIKFALDYFIKYKPGALRYPHGLHYIIQNQDVINAWNKTKEQKMRNEIKKEAESIKQSDDNGDEIDIKNDFIYKPHKPRSFTDILS